MTMDKNKTAMQVFVECAEAQIKNIDRGIINSKKTLDSLSLRLKKAGFTYSKDNYIK